MKNTISLGLLLFSMSTLSAQKLVKTTVNSATLFFNGAQIERNVSVQLEKGENTIKFSGIDNAIVNNTLQVVANESITILTSVHTVANSERAYRSQEENLLIDSLNDFQYDLEELNIKMRNYQNEKNLILANKEVRGANNGFDLNDLTQLAHYYRTNLNDLDLKILAINRQIKEINKSRTRVNSKLTAIGYSPKVGLITSKIISENRQKVNLTIKYMVNSVYWTPFYDIKVKDLDKPLKILTKGKITQNSNVQWDNVTMTLSTTIPSMYGVKPNLTPWYLNFMGYRKNLDMSYEYSQNVVVKKSKARVESNSLTAKDFTSLRDNIIAKEYTIEIPYSIRNKGTAVVEIQESEAKSDFYYYAAPKVQKKVFLLADIGEWETLDLIPGEANIYLNGVFMGNTYIDPGNIDDTMSLMIGEDKTVQVDRKKLTEFCKNSTFGSSKKTEMAMQVIVKNNKSKSIRVIVDDQVPLSTIDKIEVTVEDVSGANHNKETGILTWEFTLPANDSKTLDIKYVVKHPKNKRINL